MWNKIKLITIFILTIFLLVPIVSAWVVSIPYDNYDKVSIPYTPHGSLANNVNTIWINLLTTVKVILEGVLFIYMIIIWIQMIISMWSDEESITKSKNQIRYSMVALIFINIPGTLYSLFYNDNPATIWYLWWWTWTNWWSTSTNLFLNYDLFWNFLWNNNSWFWLTYDLFGFIQILIFAIAVIMIIIAGVKIMTSRWKDDVITEWKNKIIFSVIWIILVWFISAWRNVVFTGKIATWVTFFGKLANLSLVFAGPVAIFFLSLAWYYFITSNGDDERIKKAKNIIINTVIATLILLASYTFLLDLANL